MRVMAHSLCPCRLEASTPPTWSFCNASQSSCGPSWICHCPTLSLQNHLCALLNGGCSVSPASFPGHPHHQYLMTCSGCSLHCILHTASDQTLAVGTESTVRQFLPSIPSVCHLLQVTNAWVRRPGYVASFYFCSLMTKICQCIIQLTLH